MSQTNINTDDCWLYAASPGHYNKYGHGRVTIQQKGKTYNFAVHRVMYENMVGEIPEGLTLDHLCRVPPCINPKHLEPVTLAVNTLRGFGPTAINARKTHCTRGHALEGNNLEQSKRGWRECRTCHIYRSIRSYHRNKKPAVA